VELAITITTTIAATASAITARILAVGSGRDP
jgi:hypothetical protein